MPHTKAGLEAANEEVIIEIVKWTQENSTVHSLISEKGLYCFPRINAQIDSEACVQK